MSWVNPKLNWKDTDFYNTEDLNRVEANTEYIANYLINLQYPIALDEVKTDRVITSIDLISNINRVENNIEEIRKNFVTPPGWKNKKVWTTGLGFDYTDANRLEKNLDLLHYWSQKAKDNQIFCGTFSCGSEWEGGLY